MERKKVQYEDPLFREAREEYEIRVQEARMKKPIKEAVKPLKFKPGNRVLMQTFGNLNKEEFRGIFPVTIIKGRAGIYLVRVEDGPLKSTPAVCAEENLRAFEDVNLN